MRCPEGRGGGGGGGGNLHVAVRGTLLVRPRRWEALGVVPAARLTIGRMLSSICLCSDAAVHVHVCVFVCVCVMDSW